MKVEHSKSNNAYKPMKGAHLILNENILEFLRGKLSQIEQFYSDEQADEDAKAILDDLEASGWVRVKDKFGDKAYEYIVYPVGPSNGQGELRVGVALTRSGLMLDIRPWGEY
jgi:hypothetical protein